MDSLADRRVSEVGDADYEADPECLFHSLQDLGGGHGAPRTRQHGAGWTARAGRVPSESSTAAALKATED